MRMGMEHTRHIYALLKRRDIARTQLAYAKQGTGPQSDGGHLPNSQTRAALPTSVNRPPAPSLPICVSAASRSTAKPSILACKSLLR